MDNIVSNVSSKLSSLKSTIGESVTDALGDATEVSLAADEDPLNAVVTGVLGLATLFSSFGELFSPHKSHNPEIANP